MFTKKQINVIEKKYKAKFVCETCLKSITKQWANYPVSIFYTKEPHPQGSNWFGLFYNTEGKILICNGITATEPFDAVEIDDTIMYSKYRHDFFEHDGIFVDGGRDYLRCGGERSQDAKIVKLQIVEDKLEVV
jgi:hypothetical protein